MVMADKTPEQQEDKRESLAELVKEEQSKLDFESKGEKPEQQEAAEVESQEETADEADVEGQEKPEDAGEQGSEESPEAPTGAAGSESEGKEAFDLRTFLESIGFDTDGVDDKTLETETQKRLFGGYRNQPQANESNDKADRHAPRSGDDTVSPPAKGAEQADEQEAESDNKKQSESRRLAKLHVEPDLEKLVDYDSNGRAVAKENTGEEGVQAARELNRYLKDLRDRMTRIGEDPVGFFEENVSELVEQKLQARMSELEKRQEEQRQAEKQQQAEKQEQDKLGQFFIDHEKDLYKLGSNGKPLADMKTGGLVLSDYGKSVEEEYMRLKELAPSAANSQLVVEAKKTVDRFWKEQPSEPEAKPKQTTSEKKKKFLGDRSNQPAEPPVATHPATVNERAENGKVRLRDLVAEAPENQDNPAAQRLRQ